MHYHNIFLVKARNKKEAVKKVEKFLAPFNDQIQPEEGEGEYFGEWDWYQFGGRWMWSDLVEKNIDKIVKPGTTCYWNHYHDPEVMGKTWDLLTPTGETITMNYGDDYPIKDWVNEHPDLAEVKDAKDEKFFELIEHQRKAIDKSIAWEKECLTKEQTEDMKSYYQKQLLLHEGKSRWTTDTHFWNITDNSFNYDRKEILKSPTKWFIVNVDLHN
jgi:hypothetical protein